MQTTSDPSRLVLAEDLLSHLYDIPVTGQTLCEHGQFDLAQTPLPHRKVVTVQAEKLLPALKSTSLRPCAICMAEEAKLRARRAVERDKVLALDATTVPEALCWFLVSSRWLNACTFLLINKKRETFLVSWRTKKGINFNRVEISHRDRLTMRT